MLEFKGNDEHPRGPVKIDENTLIVYTDGSMLSHPRRGGMGVRMMLIDDYGNECAYDLELSGYRGAKSGQMEIEACVAALREIDQNPLFSKYEAVLIRSDSTYLVDNYQKAFFEWPRQGWLGSRGNDIANEGSWKELNSLRLRIRKRLEIQWLHNASKNEHHRAAHAMSRRSAENALGVLLPSEIVRRRWAPAATQPGCVRMLGQRLSIRVRGVVLLSARRGSRYRYEVLTKTSPFFGKSDFAVAREPLSLKWGHCYYVVFNRNQQGPEITRIIRELKSARRPGEWTPGK